MEYKVRPKGVCSTEIQFTIDGGVVHNIRFTGGCSGNSQGIRSLAEGMDAAELVRRLKDIRCGFKSTSCPDQLALAVEAALAAQPPVTEPPEEKPSETDGPVPEEPAGEPSEADPQQPPENAPQEPPAPKGSDKE